MARIRTIKPEFFTSEDIIGLSALARLLYIGLWCEADREGRFKWKPTTFKHRYLPTDKCNIMAVCGELVKAGLITLYGDDLAYIPTFKQHQIINNRETASKLDPPEDEKIDAGSDASQRRESGVKDAAVGEGKGREGKGRERNKEREREEIFVDFPNHPRVRRMKKPLTRTEYAKLLAEFGSKKIDAILDAMENYTPLHKNQSAFLTAKNWCERAQAKANTTTTDLPPSTFDEHDPDFKHPERLTTYYHVDYGQIYVPRRWPESKKIEYAKYRHEHKQSA